RGYEWADKGDEFLSSGKLKESNEAYARALEYAPDNEEILYWKGITLLGSSMKEDGSAILKEIFRKNRNWIQVTKSLLDRGYITKSEALENLMK
ncbi:MAG: tetratricopeptide repeat protein, partial [Nitrososphaerota archaeon]|nr:tetratricopeptide repeat protein [Nitrososphaerota archaeon]